MQSLEMAIHQRPAGLALPEHRLDQLEGLVRHGQEPRLQQAFLIFRGLVGIIDEPAADSHFTATGFVDLQGSDRDVEAEIALGRDPADRAGIDLARGYLELPDDLHGPNLGRAGYG